MSRRLRIIAVLGVIALLAAGCSKPKEQVKQTGGTTKGQSALTSTPVPSGKAATNGTSSSNNTQTVTTNQTKAKGYAAINPAADVAQAKKIGALIKLRSTSYTNPNTWTGVTKDTIKFAFNIDATNCGVNLLQLISQAGGNLGAGDRYTRPGPTDNTTANTEQAEAIKTLMQYWNDHLYDVAQDIPQAVDVMKKYNTPGHLVYGRKLTYDTVDGGSFQCPDKQTSAAVAIHDSIKPFSVITYDTPGLNESGYHMSDEIQAKSPANVRPMHFGLLDPTNYDMSRWAPYNWTEFQSITRMSELSASWICSTLNGKNAVNSSQYSGTKRTFALMYANNPTAKRAAVDFKNFIAQDCPASDIGAGKAFDWSKNEIVFNDNPARAADEGTQYAVKLKLNGVTSVIYLIDALGAFFHLEDYKGQNYKPELIWTGTEASTNTVQRLFVSQDMVDKASIGYTPFGIQGFGYGPGDSFWTYHAYHLVAPDGKPCDPTSDYGMTRDKGDGKQDAAVAHYCRAPAAQGAWYYSFLPLIGGLIFAGPNLTPGNVSAGLQAYPLTRYGIDGPTTDPQAVLVGSGPGQYYFITDGSTFRWRAGYISPPPESLFGFPEFSDCQRHYMKWPNQLANEWEKSGSAYNGYCPSATYGSKAFRGVDYAPAPNSGKKCTDGVNKTCELDSNYPKWTKVLYR